MDGSEIKSFGRRALLSSMLIFCTVFYYFGELVNWFGWNALRWDFFYGVHDVQRLLFLVPIVYAGYTSRVKGAAIVTLGAFAVFLPRSFFVYANTDPLIRTVLFTIFAGAIGLLVASLANRTDKCFLLESAVRGERDLLLSILAGSADGVLIIGPDYKLRFGNRNIEKHLGPAVDRMCYNYLRSLDAPCPEGCPLPEVTEKNRIKRWQYTLADGRIIQAVCAPYMDSDNIVCQFTILKDAASGKQTDRKSDKSAFSFTGD